MRLARTASPLPRSETPGQGFEPRPPRSEHGVLAVRRSRIDEISMSRRARVPVLQRSCLCHSPTLRPWIAACPRLRNRDCCVLRGGVLEPGARIAPEMCRQKPLVLQQRQLPPLGGRGPFSLRRGLECLPCLYAVSITSRTSCRSPSKRQRRPSRVALATSCYPATELAVAPPSEGIGRIHPEADQALLPGGREGRDGRG